MMEFEADRMTNLVLSDERGRARARRGARGAPHARRDRSRRRSSARPWRPRSSCTIPTACRSSAGCTRSRGSNREHALDYYRRFYTPENAILVVAGDVTADEVRRSPRRPTARSPRRASARCASGRASPIRAPRATSAVADPKVEQPTLQRAYLVPSYLTAKPGEAEALDVLVQILGAQSTGRLHRRLVMEKRVAVMPPAAGIRALPSTARAS